MYTCRYWSIPKCDQMGTWDDGGPDAVLTAKVRAGGFMMLQRDANNQHQTSPNQQAAKEKTKTSTRTSGKIQIWSKKTSENMRFLTSLNQQTAWLCRSHVLDVLVGLSLRIDHQGPSPVSSTSCVCSGMPQSYWIPLASSMSPHPPTHSLTYSLPYSLTLSLSFSLSPSPSPFNPDFGYKIYKFWEGHS